MTDPWSADLTSAFTRPLSADARRLISRYPFVPVAQLISYLTTIYVRHTAPIPSARPSQEELGFGLTASAPVWGVSAAVCTNGVWLPLRPVSVAQNKPSTMSSNVKSVNLLMQGRP